MATTTSVRRPLSIEPHHSVLDAPQHPRATLARGMLVSDMAHRALVLFMATFAIDVARAADPTTPPPAEAAPAAEGEVRSKRDDAIGTAVAHHLADDPRVRAMNIKVAVREGVVTLTGTATSVEEKDAAEAVVQRVSGVRRVENRLAVDGLGEPAPGASMIPEIPAAP